MIPTTPYRKPSFFKVLVGDFEEKLQIPPAFVIKHKRWLPERVSLKCGVRGLSWKIKIEVTDDHGYYFTKGWKEFVEHVNLNYGDFIIFRLINEKTLDVAIYDTTCCEKVIDGAAIARRVTKQANSKGNAAAGHHRAAKMGVERWVDGGANSSKRDHHVVRILKEYERSIFSFSTADMLMFGLKWSKGTVIKDPLGRVWPVKISLSRMGSRKQYSRYYLTTGWSKFISANGVAAGDTLKFQIREGHGDVMDVEILNGMVLGTNQMVPETGLFQQEGMM